MALEAQPLFNFFFRYKWNEDDFRDWQDGMMNINRAVFESLLNGAVGSGFDVTPVSGMLLQVSPGIAMGPSGYVMVENDANNISFTAPGSNVRKDLIVARPKIVDDTPITRPTSPFDTVYLKQLQDCEVVVIQGAASAQPDYPAKQANDVVLAGVRIATGAVTLSQNDIEFEVKDFHGKNSDLCENFARYDSRMFPYRSTRKVMGIRPSQLDHPLPRGFSFIGQAPSIFPKDVSGDYANADTFLDFESGAITGGDAQSADFTPVIPGSGQFVVAVVAIDSNDELQVSFGNVGTRSQCLNGIRNQEAAGAGSVLYIAGTKIICFTIIGSSGGVTIDDLEVIDARSWGGGSAGGGSSTPGVAGGTVVDLVVADFPYTITSLQNGNVFNVDATGAVGTLDFQLPSPATNFKVSVKDTKGLFGTLPCRFLRDGSENFENLAADYLMEANYGTWTPYSNGIDYFLI